MVIMQKKHLLSCLLLGFHGYGTDHVIVSKAACHQNPNVCFDLDFFAKKNYFLRTGSS